MKNITIAVLSFLLLLGCNTKNKQDQHFVIWNLILDSVQLYEVAESYPDSIIVAFTRNGIFEDSIIAYKQGFIKDSLGNSAPAYAFRAVVGDAWIYDSDGNFVEFIESELPHSGKGHKYNP